MREVTGTPSLLPNTVRVPIRRILRAQSLFRDRGDGAVAGARASRLWEICEDRYQVRSMILRLQLPVSRWHEQIGDPTLADGILDRLVHNAYRIEMRGDSMRKNRGKPST